MSKKTLFWGLVSAIYIAISFTALMFSSSHIPFLEYDWNVGLLLFLSLILYTIKSSLGTIGPQELGLRLFLDRPVDEVSSGFVFVPWLVCTLVKETRLLIQNELPSDPEHIFRGDGIVPDKMFPPIRITFGPPVENDGIPANDPYNVRMTAEVVPVITWQINDFVSFYTKVGSLKEARRQLEDESVATLTEAFSKITPAAAMKELSTHAKGLKQAIDIRVEGWGIDVTNVKLKPFNFSHALNTAVLLIPEATVRARATVIQATGEKEKRELEGQGAAGAEKALLDARTAGLENMATKLVVDGSVVLASETARGITNNPGQKTIIAGSGGFSDLATVGAILGGTLAEGGKK